MWMLRLFFLSSRRRHTRWTGDWSSDVCSSDLVDQRPGAPRHAQPSERVDRGPASPRIRIVHESEELGHGGPRAQAPRLEEDRKSTRLNSSHPSISYAVFCLKKKKQKYKQQHSV